MTKNDFIFSNKTSHRVTRHLAFWTIFSIGFFLQSIVPTSDMYFSAFLSLCLFFPAVVVATYLLLYIFLPQFLKKQLYIEFTASFLLLAFSCYIINYFTASIFVSIACNCKASSIPISQKLGLAFLNTLHALTIGVLALGIQFAKNWYLQQEESLRLANQKIWNELKLQKGSIYPGFLFQSLYNLHTKITKGSSRSSVLLIKLSDLLSYILYESNVEYAPLEKEIGMLINRLEIEKINRDGNLNFQLGISGNPANKDIVPMTLFPLVENFFMVTDCKKNVALKINLQIVIESKKLALRLAFNKLKIANLGLVDWPELLNSTRCRLKVLYPDDIELEMIQEKNIIIVKQTIFMKSSSLEPISTPSTTAAKFRLYENS